MFDGKNELLNLLFSRYTVPLKLIFQCPDLCNKVELFSNEFDGVIFFDFLIDIMTADDMFDH